MAIFGVRFLGMRRMINDIRISLDFCDISDEVHFVGFDHGLSVEPFGPKVHDREAYEWQIVGHESVCRPMTLQEDRPTAKLLVVSEQCG